MTLLLSTRDKVNLKHMAGLYINNYATQAVKHLEVDYIQLCVSTIPDELQHVFDTFMHNQDYPTLNGNINYSRSGVFRYINNNKVYEVSFHHNFEEHQLMPSIEFMYDATCKVAPPLLDSARYVKEIAALNEYYNHQQQLKNTSMNGARIAAVVITSCKTLPQLYVLLPTLCELVRQEEKDFAKIQRFLAMANKPKARFGKDFFIEDGITREDITKVDDLFSLCILMGKAIKTSSNYKNVNVQLLGDI